MNNDGIWRWQTHIGPIWYIFYFAISILESLCVPACSIWLARLPCIGIDSDVGGEAIFNGDRPKLFSHFDLVFSWNFEV